MDALVGTPLISFSYPPDAPEDGVRAHGRAGVEDLGDDPVVSVDQDGQAVQEGGLVVVGHALKKGFKKAFFQILNCIYYLCCIWASFSLTRSCC